MKRFFCFLTALTVFVTSSRADEGMWLLPLLQKMNGKEMKEMGCKLSPEEIYSINNSSLKDAVVQFGGGCTAEIISNNGLLVTNHHCGYSNIQKLSSVEHDYLKDGFWAMNQGEELPCKGLTVTFLENMTDVTAVVNKAKKDAEKNGKDVDEAVQEVTKKLEEDANAQNPHCKAQVESFYNQNVYYLIIYKTYNDIRFVGAPPSSIGKFGADTDNWMWPRHTGDFSMFRVYADKDNNPAEYSKENVPYTPKKHLKISLKGIQEGDFTMIMGYPGRTTRFQTSPELNHQLTRNDISIAARTIRQEEMLEEMLADPKVKIQYASKYSGSTNAWKKWQGMKLAFEKLGIIERAKAEEAEFMKWVNKNCSRKKEYGNVLKDLQTGVENYKDFDLAFTLSLETLYRLEAPLFAFSFVNICESGKDAQTACKMIAGAYKDYSEVVDRKVAKAMMKYYRDHDDKAMHPASLPENFAKIDIDQYIDNLYDNSVFSSYEKLEKAVNGGQTDFTKDPAVTLGSDIITVISYLMEQSERASAALEKARNIYSKGLLEWKKGEPSYPDANFTMRLTYGTVKGYSPKDAVTYRYYTTLDGVMEKEDPDNWEFVVPAKLKELWETKDFGEYAMENGKMPVAFLSNNDITGGNSGSPIMNADGELIGLAFDGNWESMSSDVMFEPDLQRCINVDIRYVLFIVDKFGGAGWLLDEMTIVK